jgi:PPOX class probable F420-dependent enzyme
MRTEILTTASEVGRLGDARYLSLTTFKCDGTPVACPVWVVSDDGRRLLVATSADTGKVKRLRHNTRVLVAQCTATGKVRGDPISGRGRLMDPNDGTLVASLMQRKYGLWVPFMRTVYWVGRVFKRRPRPDPAFIEIVDG